MASITETRLIQQTTEKDQDTPERILDNLTNPAEEEEMIMISDAFNTVDHTERISRNASRNQQQFFAKEADPLKRESLGAWKHINKPEVLLQQSGIGLENSSALTKQLSSQKAIAAANG